MYYVMLGLLIDHVTSALHKRTFINRMLMLFSNLRNLFFLVSVSQCYLVLVGR